MDVENEIQRLQGMGADGQAVRPLSLLTLAELVKTEKSCPEILSYNHAVVKVFATLLKNQKNRIEQMEVNEKTKFWVDAMKLEIERVQYLLKSYLRVRLAKIESQLYHLFSEDLADLLSDAEQSFAIKIYKQNTLVLRESFLNEVPRVHGWDIFQAGLQKGEKFKNKDWFDGKIGEGPSLDKYVFCRLNRDIPGFFLDNEEALQDSIGFAPYRLVRNLIRQGAVDLI